MVVGGLIIVCTILLLSTLLLACKVCQLSSRIKALSSNTELISSTEYWTGTAKKNKSEPETEPKETSVLMGDISQTQQEMGNGATEEGGKVNKERQMGEEDKKEVGDTAKSEEASAAENSSSSKPQEEAANSQPTDATAASTSESKEETDVE
ncbi:uncharacterized protein [Chaetodon trifascialis]|uniref:uncharacterized protein n=1 Tax=Chaetodon trifascialis TaxID=109706 RepID=UPI003990EC1F